MSPVYCGPGFLETVKAVRFGPQLVPEATRTFRRLGTVATCGGRLAGGALHSYTPLRRTNKMGLKPRHPDIGRARGRGELDRNI